jgi:ATP-dependent protease ClpP protease subunit
VELKTALKNQNFVNRVMDSKVFMLLNKDIGGSGDEDSISGSSFSEEMYYWKSQGKEIEVKINSLGGRVVQGWSMVDSIIETKANTFNAGVAYSMAGICLMAGSHRKAYNFSKVMIHAPHAKKGVNVPSDQLEAVKSQFRELLKSRTKFTEAEINDMVDSGKDYYFSAKEALTKGIIDEIVQTDKVFNFNEDQIHAGRALYMVFNSALKEELNIKSKTHMNIFAKFFKKETEEEAVVAAMEMKAENDQLKAAQASEKTKFEAEKKALEDKIKDLENAGKANEVKAKATELIENAVKAGKMSFTADADKAKAIEGAAANFDYTKALIDGMKATKTVAAVSTVKEEKEVKLEYSYLANHDPKKLEEIEQTQPDLYAKLVQDFHNNAKKLN